MMLHFASTIIEWNFARPALDTVRAKTHKDCVFKDYISFLGALGNEVESKTIEDTVKDARWFEAWNFNSQKKLEKLSLCLRTRSRSVANRSTRWSNIQIDPLSDTHNRTIANGSTQWTNIRIDSLSDTRFDSFLRDYTQSEGVDFTDTFSSLVKMIIVRTILSIVTVEQ